ncbi:hypothetical protein [Embleya scabrispora]|uniref:hypothetical protein n=1 Tax=Embleya scabrispora TaxID=159449 RepID=UPI00036A986E|nr:hypothetical protein [Embleya scabrispora]MYS86644.1 hypothetical protein [Streptomyces sp. SID5474]
MSTDALFDQPDITDADPDGPAPLPSYTGHATRVGNTWVVEIRDLPDGRTATAQGRTWREAKEATGAGVSKHLPAGHSGFGVDLVPADPDADAAITALIEARVALAYAEQAVRDAARHAARTLIDQGWNNRDIGAALSLSHQRVSQIAPRDA